MTPPRPHLLLTSFGPFPGVPINPTYALAADVARRLAEVAEVTHLDLPTRFNLAAETLLDALDRLPTPGAIIALGVSGRAEGLHLETQARNWRRPDQPDAAGQIVSAAEATLIPGAPPVLHTQAPIAETLALLAAHDHAAAASDDAGAYLCNELMFHLLRWAAQRGFTAPASFIHVPHPASPEHHDALVDALALVARAWLAAPGGSAQPRSAEGDGEQVAAR